MFDFFVILHILKMEMKENTNRVPIKALQFEYQSIASSFPCPATQTREHIKKRQFFLYMINGRDTTKNINKAM